MSKTPSSPVQVAKTLSDQGVLQVQLLNGGDIHGADRSGALFLYQISTNPAYLGLGKSDPYVVFTLDGEKVFKSQTKKKTLNPEWNETFAVTVVSATLGSPGCLFIDDETPSLLGLQRISNSKCLTGTKLSKPKAWDLPGSTSERLNLSTAQRYPSL